MDTGVGSSLVLVPHLIAYFLPERPPALLGDAARCRTRGKSSRLENNDSVTGGFAACVVAARKECRRYPCGFAGSRFGDQDYRTVLPNGARDVTEARVDREGVAGVAHP